MPTGRQRNEMSGYKFVHQLPFGVFRKLGILLDCNNDWRILGGEYMKFDYCELERFGRAFLRRESATEEMLFVWGSKNNKVTELFWFLAEMKHYQAMKELMPYVDERYHRLIKEGVSRPVSDMTSVSIKQPADNKKLDPGSSPCDEKQIPNCTVPVTNNQKNQNDAPEKTDIIDHKELGSGLPVIDYEVLRESTNHWSKSNILGQGGFGVVFMGMVKQTPMAIKRLKRQKGNEMAYDALKAQLRDLFKELKYLDSNRHDNILPLYGYSYEQGNFCLVSQFMPNGSLEDRLLCRNNSLPLSARIRCYIARGTARGLQFLHDREKPLVHGDIKSANILLDRSFEPKIGDFGLSREGPTANYSYVQVSKVHGTRPYLPDEFLRGKKFSTKVDTYSFGVVLFEIITGLRAYDETRSEKFLKDYVLKLSEENDIRRAIDPKIGFEFFALFASYVFTVAKSCVSYRAKNRPAMTDVSRSLDHLNSYIGTINFQRPANYYIDPSRRSNLSTSAASSPPEAGHQINQRTPSPTNPVAAAPNLQKVHEESTNEMCAVGVADRPELLIQISEAQNDPAHVYVNYLPLDGLNIYSKSKEAKVKFTTSDSKSNPDDQDCSGSDGTKQLLDEPTIVSSDELPVITQLQS